MDELEELDERFEDQVTLLHATICQAMAEPMRILIVFALSKRAMYVHELAEVLQKPPSTVSRHLKVLRDRRIVITERDGTSVKYSLTDARVVDALNIMRSVLRDMMSRDAELVR
jgi:DNA-binding transcriptional ArsR family regulator